MQEIMQKLVTTNIKDETFGHGTDICNNLPTNQVSPQKPQCTMWLHLYRKQWKTGSYTWAFLDIEGATDSTSCDICGLFKKNLDWNCSDCSLGRMCL